MVEMVIHLYFKDFYDMGRPLIVNTWSLVDLRLKTTILAECPHTFKYL